MHGIQPTPIHSLYRLEKAFDSVETSAVMQALRNQGIDEAYINIMKKIYSGSTATKSSIKKATESQ